MNTQDESFKLSASQASQQRISNVAGRFVAAWQAADTDAEEAAPDIESYLAQCNADERVALFRELLNADLFYRRKRGEQPARADYEKRFSDLADAIQRIFNNAADSVDGSMGSTLAPPQKPGRDPEEASPPVVEPIPETIGRYRVDDRIDAGNFGTVYRAHDPQIDRKVAIKVPHRHRISGPEDVELFLREARIMGQLEHPHIVPIYDTGTMGDGRCFVVSKWIEGCNLATLIKQQRPGFEDSARLVAKIASALHVAERQKITHRDIKPANILIDLAGEPFVTDFGLAIREEDIGNAEYQGMTPAYASPEQARGESHRVDGQTDIFSLGVVFYELLSGERPFSGKTARELLERIKRVDARPPRQLDPSIPPGLERVCLKALEKLAINRYSTAFDMANDLRLFLQEPAAVNPATGPPRIFVSYRRDDSLAFVRLLHSQLQSRFGDDAVFLDVVSMKDGVDFRRQIDEALNRCDALLAVIGPDWAGIRMDRTRRLDDEEDFVRIEVETALARGMFVIPVPVGHTPIPKADELPESLKQLSYLQPCPVDPGRDFEQHVERLCGSLDRIDKKTSPSSKPIPTPTTGREPTPTGRVIPKGLRSFDRADADFFLKLLPGPAGLDLLPESIRFWRTRIEETDPDETFRVGVIYGPSGCGKSSLMKAGLLPSLADHVQPLYIECTADETEARLLHLLRKNVPSLSKKLDLVAAMAERRRAKNRHAPVRWTSPSVESESNSPVRWTSPSVESESNPDDAPVRWTSPSVESESDPDGRGRPSYGVASADRLTRGQRTDRKLIIVLDQFEQWLHANRGQEQTELSQALRQCDGRHVQAVLMVRDEYWMPATRFMGQLEVPLVQGENSASVDLFDPRHAHKVLIEFGHGYDRLPKPPAQLSNEQECFVDQVVSDLTDKDDKIISVQLALFADMVKGKPWTPETFEDVGGAKGVGVTYLKETFTGTNAPPQHRLHQKAARATLRKLLPEAGTDIKGGMRSEEELREASGYAERPQAFDELMGILNRETRLVTPVDREGSMLEDVESEPASKADERHYQLTHDYLVPSLRKWLDLEDGADWSGRAHLRLEARTENWKSSRENRQLPALWETINIGLLARKRDWTQTQRQMMHRAARYHGVRSAVTLVAVLILGTAAMVVRNGLVANGLVDGLLAAEVPQIPERYDQLDQYRRGVRSRLEAAYDSLNDDQRLKANLALIRWSKSDEPFVHLRNWLFQRATPAEVPVIRDALKPRQAELVELLWKYLESPQVDEEQQRLRAACTLAGFALTSDRWTSEVCREVALRLVSVPANLLGPWMENLQPVSQSLIEPLSEVFRDETYLEKPLTVLQRTLAADVLVDFAADRPDTLAGLIADSDQEQFSKLYPVLLSRFSQTPESAKTIKDVLAGIVQLQPEPDLSEPDRVRLGKRRASAAAALLRLEQNHLVLNAFEFDADPESLTQFVHGCKSRGVSVESLLDLWPAAHDERHRFGLLLAFGEFKLEDVPTRRRDSLRQELVDLYGTDPSSAIHGASGWLLRTWGFAKEVADIDRTELAPDESGQRQWFVQKITTKASPKLFGLVPGKERSSYYTFVVFPPDRFVMGSPAGEEGRSNDEAMHHVTMTRGLAIMDREVTVEQWLQFDKGEEYGYSESQSPSDMHPVTGPDWYMAVEFCRWLTVQANMTEEDQCYDDPLQVSESQMVRLMDGRMVPGNWPLRKDRRGFRIVTAAEWEYACRSGMRTTYGFGGDRELLGNYGWYEANSQSITHPGRELRPNLRGMFDFHGNVYEWCHDWYSAIPEDDIDPMGPIEGQFRVLRGGSFLNLAHNLRSADRYSDQPDGRYDSFGFRVARTYP